MYVQRCGMSNMSTVQVFTCIGQQLKLILPEHTAHQQHHNYFRVTLRRKVYFTVSCVIEKQRKPCNTLHRILTYIDTRPMSMF
jgi:hypothetical protein